MPSQFSLANLFAWMTLAAVGAAMVHWFGANGAAGFAVATMVAIFLRFILVQVVSPLILSSLLTLAAGIACTSCTPSGGFQADARMMCVAGCLVGIVSQFIELPKRPSEEPSVASEEPLIEDDGPSWPAIIGVALLLVAIGVVTGAVFCWLDARAGPNSEDFFWNRLPYASAMGFICGTLIAVAFLIGMLRKP